jgi:hypothetical protein
LPRRGNRGGPRRILLSAAIASLLAACSPKDAPPSAPPVSSAPAPAGPRACRLTLTDAEDRPVREVRLALLAPGAFDGQGRLRDEAVASAPERLRIVVEDPEAGGPDSVTVSGGASSRPLTLRLAGPPGRRVTPFFLLLGDREDAAAAPATGVEAAPGDRLVVRYRDAARVDALVGPAVIHEIPIRFIAVGIGLPPSPEFERALDLRLAQANVVWRPLGRRFVRGPVQRIEALKGLALIRGRAAGVDAKGQPSRSGLLVEGREVSIPCFWKEDGAPLTPRSAARALIEAAGKGFQVEVYDGLAGDREAVVLRWRRRDGAAVSVARLPEAADVGQAVMPLQIDLKGGIEAAPSGTLLSLEEMALLASGRTSPADGFDVIVVSELRSLASRPAFKVYPQGLFSGSLAGSAIMAWSLLDGTGRFPYGLARATGELLLPPAYRPAPEDTLFAEPLSEHPGVEAHKRIGSVTGSRIAERGRGLSTRK